MVSVIIPFIPCVSSSLHVHKVTILRLLTFKVTAWSFKDALAELKVKKRL